MNIKRLRLGTATLSAVLLGALTSCSYLPWHSAPAVSEDWCADATLFAMHSVRSNEQGMSYADIDRDLDATDVAYLQLYPALSIADMHRLLHDIATHNRARFAAAQAVLQSCEARGTPEPAHYAPSYLSTPHSDAWCGQATDFAMGTAGYRDIGFTEKQMEASLHNDPLWLNEVFPALNTPDRVELVRAVYGQKWSRYTAAASLGKACKVAPAAGDADHAATRPDANQLPPAATP
ncbi:MAG: hypothetical protein EPN72_05485 [Nevskiaceae bacterium]|nr:MAG: hypothetical protein EPN63_03710 [Nevskiaceae bacterium]TBR73588.1 MAG: hypothetical protein EPN72_05485 [Nevskiaceae bacterium]